MNIAAISNEHRKRISYSAKDGKCPKGRLTQKQFFPTTQSPERAATIEEGRAFPKGSDSGARVTHAVLDSGAP